MLRPSLLKIALPLSLLIAWGESSASLRDCLDLFKPLKTVAAAAPHDRPILIISDAHFGKVGGIQSLMRNLEKELAAMPGETRRIQFFTSMDAPAIEIKSQSRRLAIVREAFIARKIEEIDPSAIHIMTEGPLGNAARKYLAKKGIPFTTAYTIQLPEYAEKMAADLAGNRIGRIAKKIVAGHVRSFHEDSQGILVATESLKKDLIAKGFPASRMRDWSRGVDYELFNPSRADPELFKGLPRPISIYAGRVSVEKNLEDFLDLKIPGTKVVVGDGAEKARWSKDHPDVIFIGKTDQAGIAKHLASADVMVFPSLTDTFGQVQLEANASGIPVVAYRVPGPQDVIKSPASGVLAEYNERDRPGNLARLADAWHQAIGISKKDARAYAETWSWKHTTQEFLGHLVPIPSSSVAEFGKIIGPEALEAEQELVQTTPLFSHVARWTGALTGKDQLSGLVSQPFRPAAGNAFALPSLLVPLDQVPLSLRSASLTDAERKILFVTGPDGTEYLRYFYHPDSAGKIPHFQGEVVDPEKWFATSQSSGRTLVVKSADETRPEAFIIKTSVFKKVGRYKRNIDAERAVRAVKVSDELERIHVETGGRLGRSGKTWDFLREPFAMTTDGDEMSQAGYIFRAIPDYFPEDIVLPWYALVAKREGKATRWIDDLFAASGAKNQEDFLWSELVEPSTELHCLFSMENGLTTELHQQNLRVRIDRKTLRVKGLVVQDMDAHFVDHSLRVHRLGKPVIAAGDWDESLYLFRYGQAQPNEYQSYVDKLRLESFEWVLKYIVDRGASARLISHADALVVEEFNRAFPDYAVRDFSELKEAWDRLHASVTTPAERKSYDDLAKGFGKKSRISELKDRLRELNGALGPRLPAPTH